MQKILDEAQVSSRQAFSEMQQSLPNYDKILLTCALASEVVYEDNPIGELNLKFMKHNHLIRNAVVSKIIEKLKSSNESQNFQMKYMICNAEKLLIVAFRGTDIKCFDDIRTDLDSKPDGTLYDLNGKIHVGFLKRCNQVPIDFFVDKIINHGFDVVFTGHSLGAAVASLITLRVLYEKQIYEMNLNKKILCIGFGVPAFVDEEFKISIEKEFKNNFHYYVNKSV